MFNFKIIIEYDGTNYVGWQRQKNGHSIQEAIETAIFKLTSEKVTIFGAGRTDAGVHALAQVAHFNLSKNFKKDNIRDGINQHLRPQPIAIIEAYKKNQNFHARFSAKKRTYKYIITNRRSPLTLNKSRSWCVFKKLDITKMKYEAESFIGKHNLEAFRSINCQSNTTIKTIDNIKITKKNNDIFIDVSAKSFLHSQVRIMVGTLVEIGKGKITKSIKTIIANKRRSYAGITAPACGLYLIKVKY
jgi:tRNA pseudouridine38-40 synthase